MTVMYLNNNRDYNLKVNALGMFASVHDTHVPKIEIKLVILEVSAPGMFASMHDNYKPKVEIDTNILANAKNKIKTQLKLNQL